MKTALSLCLVLFGSLLSFNLQAQTRPVLKPREANVETIRAAGNSAIVIDETLSVLRVRPSLFAESSQRMRRGRKVQILESRQADGVTFYRVSAPPQNSGWVQSEAVFGKFRRGDDERLARLVQASDGFDQLEIAEIFFATYPDSSLRPAILLLFGDLAEDAAAKLSRDAARRLIRREMAASGAPLHSYYLNFVSLDRYRKLGIIYLFNVETKAFLYDGASWQEIIKRFPKSAEAVEARKRLDALKTNLEKSGAK